ncbi:MAG: hypothetical protein Ct9H300mP8_06820 [Gammaproteobacteria bacterium]|nr:MAG: hypothetical protein Ct9H300mP8_06820 [Gammaproteobacteria bacterium]
MADETSKSLCADVILMKVGGMNPILCMVADHKLRSCSADSI